MIASFAGSTDFKPTRSSAVTFMITPAMVQTTVLPPRPIFNKKKKLVSVNLTVEIKSTVLGAGPPAGIVDFELARKGRGPSRPKVLGQAVLQGGTATVSLAAKKLLNQTIAIYYSASGYESVYLPLPRFTTRALKALAQSH